MESELQQIFIETLRGAPSTIILVFFVAWAIKKYVINGLHDAIKNYFEAKLTQIQQQTQATSDILAVMQKLLETYETHTILLKEIAAHIGGRRQSDNSMPAE